MQNLKVNELFAGIGAFRKALINLNIPHEIVGISEIDKYAIKSYEAMYGETRNYGDISKVERLDYADLWTYGFPCQDISLAGDMKGIVKGETRSGLLHEVERLLEVAKEEGTLPKFLIMENVKNLVSKKFIGDFQRWIDKLSDLGYATEWKTLIASDYGIPQRRERVFAVSVRKDRGGYSFPKPMPLKKKFRDLLEEEVEEMYFLRKEMFEYFEKHSEDCKEKGLGFRFQPVARENCEIAKTITTREGTRYENFIQEKTCKQVGKLVGSKWDNRENISRVYCTDSLCPTITAGGGGHHEVKIVVPEATKKGYAIAEKGDSIDIAYINQNKRRVRVDKERAHTITTSPQIGMLTDHGVRKLTPRECFRLMGFSDSDFEKAQAVCSNTQLYKQAGDSIVVNVLEEILKKLLL
ncbi:DNA (cytosine-5-)-methyltransferase [Oribacterium sp.]